MGSCFITRRGGAGAAGEVFAVESAAKLPATAREGKIAIVSDLKVNGILTTSTEITGISQAGDTQLVYTTAGVFQYARQYTGQRWVYRDTYVRVASQWVMYARCLYSFGKVFTTLYKGEYSTYNSNYSYNEGRGITMASEYITQGLGDSYNLYGTHFYTNLTGFSTLRGLAASPNPSGSNPAFYTRLFATSACGNNQNAFLNLTASTAMYYGSVATVNVNISSINQNYYVGLISRYNDGLKSTLYELTLIK